MKPRNPTLVLPGLFSEGEEPQPAPNPVRDEIERLSAAAGRVLAYLQARPGQWVTNVELARPDVGGLRAVGRLHEIGKHHRVEKRHIERGLWAYRLGGV